MSTPPLATDGFGVSMKGWTPSSPKAWAAIFIDAQGTAARSGEEIRNASLDSSRPSAHGDNT
jgi:hypothetical protein